MITPGQFFWIVVCGFAVYHLIMALDRITTTQGSRAMRIVIMDQQHLGAVMEIEKRSFDTPETKKEIKRAMESPGVIAQVALLDDEEVGGFIIYQMHPEWILVYDLAVWPGNRRQKIGTKLVEAMKRKLGTRLEIRVFVCERNLKAQLFYKACGFRAIETRPNPNSDGEMYLMVFFKNGEPVNAWESVPDDKEEWCDGA